MLIFEGDWRFEAPACLPEDAVAALHSLILRISPLSPAQPIYEMLKRHFALAAGRQVWTSSNASFARQDLLAEMKAAAANEALFLEALYDGLEGIAAGTPGVLLPPWSLINQILERHGGSFAVAPPNLIPFRGGLAVTSPPTAAWLETEARAAIQASWREAEVFLASGKHRQAVQESIWLLETAVTALRGTALAETTTVQGRYFNRIAEEFRAHAQGQLVTQVLGWIRPFHGFLSSPTGGGVRHGADVSDVRPLQDHEARLYCNLARSYVTYILEEYDRLVAGDRPR